LRKSKTVSEVKLLNWNVLFQSGGNYHSSLPIDGQVKSLVL